MIDRLIFMAPAIFLGLSACDVVRDEIYSPGGYVAVQADRYQKAVTPAQHVDRYRTFFFFAAPLALTAAYDAESAQDAAEDVREAWEALEALAVAVQNCGYDSAGLEFCTYPPMDADGENDAGGLPANIEKTSLSFETLSLEVQRELGDLSYRMTENIGVRLDIDSFDLESITGLLGSIFELRDQAPALRKAAATFRDMTHIFVRSVAHACPVTKSTPTLMAQLQFLEGTTAPQTVTTQRVAKGACADLREQLKDFYVDGTTYWQPSLDDGASGERRLKRLLSLTRKVIEENREIGRVELGANGRTTTWRYWTEGTAWARSYVHQQCVDAGARHGAQKQVKEDCDELD